MDAEEIKLIKQDLQQILQYLLIDYKPLIIVECHDHGEGFQVDIKSDQMIGKDQIYKTSDDLVHITSGAYSQQVQILLIFTQQFSNVRTYEKSQYNSDSIYKMFKQLMQKDDQIKQANQTTIDTINEYRRSAQLEKQNNQLEQQINEQKYCMNQQKYTLLDVAVAIQNTSSEQ